MMQLAWTFLFCLLPLAPVTSAPLMRGESDDTGVFKEHVLNDDGYKKWCMEIQCSEGEMPLVLCSQTPPFSCSCPIECTVCGDGYFMSASYYSSSMEKCRHMKVCSGDGQIIEVRGSRTTDNVCGCDTKRGYVLRKSDQFCDCPSGECPLKVQQQVTERELITNEIKTSQSTDVVTTEIKTSQSTDVGSALQKSSDSWWWLVVVPVVGLVLLARLRWQCQWYTKFVETIESIRRSIRNPNSATPERTENGVNDAQQSLVANHENESETGPASKRADNVPNGADISLLRNELDGMVDSRKKYLKDWFPKEPNVVCEGRQFAYCGSDHQTSVVDSSEFVHREIDRQNNCALPGVYGTRIDGPIDAGLNYAFPGTNDQSHTAPRASETSHTAPTASEPNHTASMANEPSHNTPTTSEPNHTAPIANEPSHTTPTASEPSHTAPRENEPSQPAYVASGRCHVYQGDNGSLCINQTANGPNSFNVGKAQTVNYHIYPSQGLSNSAPGQAMSPEVERTGDARDERLNVGLPEECPGCMQQPVQKTQPAVNAHLGSGPINSYPEDNRPVNAHPGSGPINLYRGDNRPVNAHAGSGPTSLYPGDNRPVNTYPRADRPVHPAQAAVQPSHDYSPANGPAGYFPPANIPARYPLPANDPALYPPANIPARYPPPANDQALYFPPAIPSGPACDHPPTHGYPPDNGPAHNNAPANGPACDNPPGNGPARDNPPGHGPAHDNPPGHGPAGDKLPSNSPIHVSNQAKGSTNVNVTLNVSLAKPAQATVTPVMALSSNGGDGERVVRSESQRKCGVPEAEDGLGWIQPIQETQRETECKA